MADRNEKGQFYPGMKGAHTTHGMRGTRFYRIYVNMQERCKSKKEMHWRKYGSRGIKCLWGSFEDFRADMYESYLEHVAKHGEKRTSIDRIDNNGNYHKENCRWATPTEQGRNTRQNHLITFNGKTQNLSAWAEQYGMSHSVLGDRLRSGWSMGKATSRKSHKEYELNGQRKKLPAWAKEFNISYGLLHGRIAAGWSLERALTEKKRGNPNSR